MVPLYDRKGENGIVFFPKLSEREWRDTLPDMTSRTVTLLILSLAVLAGGCLLYPPGDGPKAAFLEKRAVPVVAAVRQYRDDRGEWPGSLNALVPGYLSASDLIAPDREIDRYNLHIDAETGYLFRYILPGPDRAAPSLETGYGGPGVNRGVYEFSDGQWRWSGYY